MAHTSCFLQPNWALLRAQPHLTELPKDRGACSCADPCFSSVICTPDIGHLIKMQILIQCVEVGNGRPCVLQSGCLPHARLRVLTLDVQEGLGASLVVQLIDVWGDDPMALLVQLGLTLGHGNVLWARLCALQDFPPVVMELPYLGWVVGKGLSSGHVLRLPLSPITCGSSESWKPTFSTNASP